MKLLFQHLRAAKLLLSSCIAFEFVISLRVSNKLLKIMGDCETEMCSSPFKI